MLMATLKISSDLQNIIKKVVLDTYYPIGKIYITLGNENPNKTIGGTWIKFGAGRCLVGVDTSQEEFSTVEKTGGEKTHKLKVSEMPSHEHGLVNANTGGYSMGFSIQYQDRGYDGNFYTDSKGGSEAHNNLQPYITCYMWKRTA